MARLLVHVCCHRGSGTLSCSGRTHALTWRLRLVRTDTETPPKVSLRLVSAAWAPARRAAGGQRAGSGAPRLLGGLGGGTPADQRGCTAARLHDRRVRAAGVTSARRRRRALIGQRLCASVTRPGREPAPHTVAMATDVNTEFCH